MTTDARLTSRPMTSSTWTNNNKPSRTLAHVIPLKVARAMKEVIDCKRIGVAVLGLEVPHAHIHLIPITKEGDMLFTNPRVPLSPEENEKLAKDIGAHVRL